MCWSTLVLSKNYFSFLYIKTNGAEESAPLICKDIKQVPIRFESGLVYCCDFYQIMPLLLFLH